MTAPEWVLIITTVFTGIVGVITAFKSNQTKNATKENSEKLDNVHVKVNGNFEEIKKQNIHLQRMLVELVAYVDPVVYERIKNKILSEENVSKTRRKFDLGV